MKQKSGFTMIELIIVISILSILAVFALPRFTNFTSSAKQATKDGTIGSLNSAIAIAHAKWYEQGATGTVTLDGSATPITMNAQGYPDIGATYHDTGTCQTLVDALMQSTAGLYVQYSGGNCIVDSDRNPWSAPINLTATAAN